MSSEDCWVFDSLVCFLHGPVWNAPLQTFIEEKSLVFDPNLQTDEHNPEVQKIYGDYKNLVDYMLGSYMEEMQISPEQFELACMEGRQQQDDNPFSLHQGLFQQIWAANDIKIFVRMMTQRNIELQLQALDLIEKNQLGLLQEGELGDNTSPTTANVGGGVNDLSNSKYAEVEDLIAKSVEREMNSPDAAITPEQEATESDVVDKFQRLNLFFEKNTKVDPDDVQSRQEYLRQQRDKILDIKKKTRAKQLLDTMARGQSLSESENTTSSTRPSSAQVAQRLLEGGDLLKSGRHSGNQDTNAAMQLRKTLAKRLRSEVVERQ